MLEISLASYASTGTGQQILLPFQSAVKRPTELWKPLD